jgi:hypothetical protein
MRQKGISQINRSLHHHELESRATEFSQTTKTGWWLSSQIKESSQTRARERDFSGEAIGIFCDF